MTYATRKREGPSDAQPHGKSTPFVSNPRRPPMCYGVPAAPADSATMVHGAARDQSATLVSADNIQPGMRVYDFRGDEIGVIKEVLNETLTFGRRWHADLQVPLEHVLAVLDRQVVLAVSRNQILAAAVPGRKAA